MQREIETYRQVTDVVPDTSREEMIHGMAELGEKLVARSQEAKINQNMSQAQLDLNALNQAHQIKYQADPTNKEGMQEFQTQRKEIFDKYGSDISPFFRGAWDDSARKLAATSDASVQGWQFKQLHVNSVASINDSMKNNFTLANTDGQNFASGQTSEVEAFANFHASQQKLAEYGASNLGEVSTKALLQNYEKDYMKSFLSGVAETNPNRAMEMLDHEDLKDTFTTQERGEFANIIAVTQKRQNLQATYGQTNNSAMVTDLVNDPNTSYYDKRLTLDKMEFNNQIPTKIAVKARRVLESQKNVDSVTSTPDMSNIVTQIYDLNAMQGVNNEDYLKGVQNIQHTILDMQEAGKLTPTDAQKLNNRLTSLTSSKVASATQGVGMNFYNANKKFETLPPEYRGQATRQLFYQFEGQDDVTPAQYDAAANKLLDKISQDRKAKTNTLVQQATGSDDDFLKSAGYSMQDVNETAAKYKMTPSQVVARLRAQRMKK